MLVFFNFLFNEYESHRKLHCKSFHSQNYNFSLYISKFTTIFFAYRKGQAPRSYESDHCTDQISVLDIKEKM